MKRLKLLNLPAQRASAFRWTTKVSGKKIYIFSARREEVAIESRINIIASIVSKLVSARPIASVGEQN